MSPHALNIFNKSYLRYCHYLSRIGRKRLYQQLDRNVNASYRHYSANEKNTGTYCTTDDTGHADLPAEQIRNFSIIAHVDHGKSTLADRLLEYTGAWKPSDFQGQAGPGRTRQVLDRLQVEQERGITVKAQTASLRYTFKGKSYLLNLIDTPGHVDFSNEVARSISVCQGVILLVDANQGVQAQTVANFYLAFTNELTVIPVLNKCDLKNADPDWAASQLKQLFGINEDEVLRISAKTGLGVDSVLEAIIERIPPPVADRTTPLRALIFDGWFHRHRGYISLLYVNEGVIKVGDQISILTSEDEVEYQDKKKKKKIYEVKELGILRPEEEQMDKLTAGQVGYLSCAIHGKDEAQLGSTVHLAKQTVSPLAGFKPARPMVFAGLYPMDQSELPKLRASLDKLLINDSGVTISVESSAALGSGFRLGFLGLLHMEVFSQRLEQEFGTETIATAPSVTYRVKVKGDKIIKTYGAEEILISNPVDMPDPTHISQISEPYVLATIITPDSFVGPITGLCHERRGWETSPPVSVDNHQRIMMKYILPLNEILIDFHDTLKSLTSGYASFDYEEHDYAPSELVKVDVLINTHKIDELSFISHISKARSEGRRLVDKLCEVLPREQFRITIQAAIGGKILARGDIKPYRKDVTAKLYGGDVTRRMKLLSNQAEGKKRLKMIANIGVPRDTFIKILKR